MKNSDFSQYNTPFQIIRRFIRVANFYGYDVSIQNKHEGSCYVAFCYKGKDLIEFIFRFSDHFLSKNNQIPAGVINEFTNLKYCIRDIQFYHKYYKLMTKSEREELWTSRYIN